MPFINPNDWLPIDVESLEPNADSVVRSDCNSIVIAGPGSGKTELLAQRASFLLDTGICQPPKHILAISFKRDAAKNLDERIQKRCPDRACRFKSLTLDSFAKGIVDRFRLALPAEWRPREGYEVLMKDMRVDEIREWLNDNKPNGKKINIDINGESDNKIKRLFENISFGHALPYVDDGINDIIRHWGICWWRQQIDKSIKIPNLSFPMINRLAAFLLRVNPKIKRALRATYCFVFLDEFQDTTASQYDLICSAFVNSDTILTAVGDSKQRIMLWAGAMQEIFKVYQQDFQASPYHLIRNYRSAPELVNIQHFIAKSVESDVPPSDAIRTETTGNCVILEFSTPEEEAEYLASLIEENIKYNDYRVRDFCIIVRQNTCNMIKQLQSTLIRRGIKIRDESLLQDILSEPIVNVMLHILRLLTKSRDAEAWELLLGDISLIYGYDASDDNSIIVKEASSIVNELRKMINNGNSLITIAEKIISLIGLPSIKSTYRQYSKGSYLKTILDNFYTALQSSIDLTRSQEEAVDDLIGENVIPAMTIHKSKGLEFKTVIFVGLEDSQWWSFRNQPEEEKRAFFVAFSRAISNVYFTFCDVRDGKWGRRQQERTQINDLYSILQNAGIKSIRNPDNLTT